MADPIKVLQSLVAPLASQYAVFERDQVLTHTQLNEVATWLDQQDRLSRVKLTGVGIINGLRVSREGEGLRISDGIGITCDGDLITVPPTLVGTQFRKYGEDAPYYAPLHPPGIELDILELVTTTDASDSTRPTTFIDDRIVLLLAETTISTSNHCTGSDCDNLGSEREHRIRVLLITHELAATLVSKRDTDVEQPALNLQELMTNRPLLKNVQSAANLSDCYKTSCTQMLGDENRGMIQAFGALNQHYPALLREVFGTSPTDRWIQNLSAFIGAIAPISCQACFGLFKDITDTWNELREAVFADYRPASPDFYSFSKHLLLGAVSGGGGFRTPFFPTLPESPAGSDSADNIRFLLLRINLLIECYEPPDDGPLRVTPTFGEDHVLGERTIPWYYKAAVHVGWNRLLSARQQANHNLGYRADEYSGSPHALRPLDASIGAYPLLRVEGHLGKGVGEVNKALIKLRTDYRLGFRVIMTRATPRADSLDFANEPYSDLHRYHYLMRQNLVMRLEDGESFIKKYTADLQKAVDEGAIPSELATAIETAKDTTMAMSEFVSRAKGALAQPTYSGYLAKSKESNWIAEMQTTQSMVANMRTKLGKLSNNDFVSPLDTLLQSTDHRTLQLAEDMLRSSGTGSSGDLIIGRFLEEHVGIDHLGGVGQGGTFVLVYDQRNIVIGDFALPYCVDADIEYDPSRSEPKEPPPPSSPPHRIFEEYPPVRFVTPVARLVKDMVGGLVDTTVSTRFETASKELAAAVQNSQEEVRRQLATQSANIEGLVKGAFSTKDVTAAVVLPGRTIATGDALLDQMVRDVEYKRQKVQTLVELSSQGNLSEASRSQAQAQLVKAQAELGDSVAETTQHVVTQKVDTSTGAAAGVASVLANSTVYITDATAASSLGSKLETLKTGTVGTSQTVLIGNLQNLNRLKR